ncbi:hypothetical protein J6P11_05065 [bacterium]|nr:hypothetical protein [bacterium]
MPSTINLNNPKIFNNTFAYGIYQSLNANSSDYINRIDTILNYYINQFITTNPRYKIYS